MTEQELLQDCLRRLNQSAIDYMLVGSMAGNYWGIPRSTHDIDFVVAYSENDIERIVRLFADDFFIDYEYLEHWATEIEVTHLLTEIRSSQLPPESS